MCQTRSAWYFQKDPLVSLKQFWKHNPCLRHRQNNTCGLHTFGSTLPPQTNTNNTCVMTFLHFFPGDFHNYQLKQDWNNHYIQHSLTTASNVLRIGEFVTISARTLSRGKTIRVTKRTGRPSNVKPRVRNTPEAVTNWYWSKNQAPASAIPKGSNATNGLCSTALPLNV